MPSSRLTGARMSYAAAIVGCVTFGCYFVLAAVCIHFLLKQQRNYFQSRHVVLTYTCLMLVVNTVYFIAAAKWSEIEFVETSEDPAVFAVQLSTTYAIIKDTAYIVNIWLADSLMILRAHIIWRNSGVLVLPIIIYFGVVATGLALLIETGKPGGTFGAGLVAPFGTVFWSTSVALNIVVTLLISIKLLRQHRRIGALQIRGPDRSYPDIVAIFVESAALYSICGLIYIPLFAIDTPLQYPFSALLASTAGIAPNLIIFRIAIGVDFKGDSAQPDPSSVIFAPISHPSGTNSHYPAVGFESSTMLHTSAGSSKAAKILGDGRGPHAELYALDSMGPTGDRDTEMPTIPG
ncbi:hypothetical protein B0H17DRAFT_668545 [Mycena rosella]|uniref:Uncharacterized protein n=1 Tax=Mycena rosella TaxID=1033263 RepID=A0AAD7GU90_MYCRO|nr:hypothetical protein B0H17DRAFT_668545 [Mycena rosella]